ncbi:glycoside hydrolase family 114 protein [Piromyces sp. E2]|nr:glycoside hydrolase family 114 protein [Piromyces sp. E2]|eukprot:OUM59160.1 glycoside hydrolase family 114 protein [Piromyces sp. E2]
MKFIFPVLSTLVALAYQVESKWTPPPGSTWNYLLNVKDDEILKAKEQILTIDVNKSSELIETLHKRGQKVICYFSGGTIEKHRKDFDEYWNTPGLIPDKNNEEGKTRFDEYWIDYRKKNLLAPLIKNRMKIAVEKKCDAIEVDCLGAYNHKIVTERWKDPLTKEDAYEFAKWLSAMAHSLDLSIGLKNVAGIAPRLVNDFDFAVVESCSMSKKICAKYEDFPKQGKAVFTVHYGDYGSFNEQIKTMVEEQKGFGYTCTFNINDDLKQLGYSYNCDTGSKTNLSGYIPKIDPNNSIIVSQRTAKPTTTKKTSTKKSATKTSVKKTTTTTYVKKTSVKPSVKKVNNKSVVKKTTSKPVIKKTNVKSVIKKTTVKPVIKKTAIIRPIIKKTASKKDYQG